jgi:hypothetical protein
MARVLAVEAAARAFDDKKTLGEIVKVLRARGRPMHPALAKALSGLYGYAGDEKGSHIRLSAKPTRPSAKTKRYCSTA